MSSPTLLYSLHGGTSVRRVSDINQEENVRNVDILLLKSSLPLQLRLAYKFSQALQHLGKRSLDFGVRSGVTPWLHLWLSI